MEIKHVMEMKYLYIVENPKICSLGFSPATLNSISLIQKAQHQTGT